MALIRNIHTERETLELAAELAAAYQAFAKTGLTVFLSGTLGAGKTTFSRGVIAAFGHSGAVKSPTYTLVEPYQPGDNKIYHFDLYRLADPEELEYMGMRDYFDEDALRLIEWPEKGEGMLPNADLQLCFEVAANSRTVNISGDADNTVVAQIMGELER